MARRPSNLNPNLKHRITIQKQIRDNPDSPMDLGNVVSSWESLIEAWAGVTHFRGNETVLASRLAGQHVEVMRIRFNSETRAVTTDWRIIDEHGVMFNIRDVTVVDNQWMDLLVESGVA